MTGYVRGMVRSESIPTVESGGHLLDYLPATALLFCGLAALAVSWLLSGAASGQYLVMTRPGFTLAQSIDLVTTDRGRVAATTRFENVVIAGSDDAHFTASMRMAGAWLAIPVPAVAGCGNSSSQEQSL